MVVSNDFKSSTLDLNGVVTISQPTALAWGPDGRLFVTEVDGDIKVMSVAFGDKNPSDANNAAAFYVTAATSLGQISAIVNRNDDGSISTQPKRQVTGIDVTKQYDANGNQVFIGGKAAATIYVSSSDSRIGAGGTGADKNLDTNSGVITKLVQTGANTWTAIDIVRGLPRSEENHSTNGFEVIQTLDANGKLIAERMIVASGGNTNSGAPSNNFAAQQETPLSGALLEIDLDMIAAMPVKTANGRSYVYDLPTLNDPARAGVVDANDPFGGNDGRNSAKLLSTGPIKIYSPGYRNTYDVEVSEDGRVWTYDNGGNNSWGGRPIGEAGDNGASIDFAQALNYIATNLNNGDGNSNDPINLEAWDPANKDQLHEATRSDDLGGRTLSAGQGGAQTYVGPGGLTYVYGGHPNPVRAEGSRAGLLFSPADGAANAFLLVSNQDSAGNGGGSDYAEVIAYLKAVESANPKNALYGVNVGDLTNKVLSVSPGVLYDIYGFSNGSGKAVAAGGAAPSGGIFLGKAGLPADVADIVAFTNPIEGSYKEGGKTDGAVDSGNGSINGLAEYTSTVLDGGGVKMSGALIAASLNQASLIVIGRDANGVAQSTTNQGFSVAADRTTLSTGGGPLGLTTVGDDYGARSLSKAFQGSIWATIFNQNGPLIEVFQPNNGAVPLAGNPLSITNDADGDGIDHFKDPFEFSAVNGYALAAGQSLVLDFNPLNSNFSTSIAGTGLLGAALDGVTPNRDAQTAAENFNPSEQRSGLYDNGGNIIPGGNAPILQIKTVASGTAAGGANTARDLMHTGIRPGPDVDKIEMTVDVKNWIPLQSGGVKAGQLTGLVFGDGTQFNFLRFAFGAVNGQPGFEVGYEINNVYTVLAKTSAPQLANSGVQAVELKLTIDIANNFDVSAAYRLQKLGAFTEIALGDFSLPVGVLRNVLTGAHKIGTGAAAIPSGASVGFLAEASATNPLKAIDFNGLVIEAIGDAPASDLILSPLVAVNAGGGAFQGVLRGQTIEFKSDLPGGEAAALVKGAPSYAYTNAAITKIDIPDTALDTLLYTERTAQDTGPWGYSIPVANGDYVIDMLFAELYHGVVTSAANNVPGKRIFDIFVENELVEDNFDVIAAADGAARQVIKTVRATVVDGSLDIAMDASVNQAKINGLAVWKVQTGDVTAPVIVSATVNNPPKVQDGPRFATIVLQDDVAFQSSSIAGLNGSELSFSGIVPASVSTPNITLSNGGKTATLVYTLQPPNNAWPTGVGGLTVKADRKSVV